MARTTKKTASTSVDTGGDDTQNVATNASPPMVRKNDLIDAVSVASGIKKKTVKPVVEAVLSELATILMRGDSLNVPPLGKLMVNRIKEGPQADIVVMKLRRAKAMQVSDGAPGGDDVEEAAE